MRASGGITCCGVPPFSFLQEQIMAAEQKPKAQPTKSDVTTPLTLPEVTPEVTPEITPLNQKVSSGHLKASR